jgi:Uma2 family endonuclease
VSEVVFAGIDLMVNTQIRPLTVDDYHRMIETGIISEGEHIELILGQVFNMVAKGTRHTLCTRQLFKQLLNLIGDQADVQSQDPITLPNNSEPEPDVVIARLRDDNYATSHPTPVDILLVIEVADSSIDFDRNTKLPIYAAAGINEYWIVNLIDSRLEIYSQPEGTIYTNTQIVLPPRLVNIPQFPEIKLDLTTIFPPKI